MSTIEVAVGRIAKAHGVRGELALDVLTDEPERRFAPGQAFVARRPRGADRTLTLKGARWHQERLLATFDEVPDRNSAEQARGLVLYVEVAAHESPEGAEEFYDHQLVGLAVRLADGQSLGVVHDVRHGAQDILVCDIAGREVLVPFVTALVPTIDLNGGYLVVADRPGLLRPEDADEARDS